MRLAFVFILFTSSLSAQQLPSFKDTTSYSGSSIIVSGNLDFNSTSVRNEISSKFIFGGFIDSEMKDNSLSKHKSVNRYGVDANGTIDYINYNIRPFKNIASGLVLRAGTNYIAGVQYPKHTFELAMYGNSNYVGETMDLSGTDLSYMAFQKFGVGLINPKSQSYITINLYNISSSYNIDFRDLSVTQNEDGSVVELRMDGDVTLPISSNFNQGFGVGFDFGYTIPFHYSSKNPEKQALIEIEARNIGVAYLYENQKQYTFDTTFVFSGFRFDQLFGDNVMNFDSLNVLDTLGVKQSEGQVFQMLPGFIQVGKAIDAGSNQKLQSFYGLRMYPTVIYSPIAYAGVDYKPTAKVHVGASFSYGGFGGFRGGIYAMANFDKLNLGLGTENILGLASSQAYGKSLNLRLQCNF